ncbi:unnamed protein product [Diatraea saccharalis]|uniref:HAT C-terminal dimerisation domain-containing protein n=1 Tax=Diatraea saccharalis TaxID=40085 RepID=A0A9N9R6E8_9NEOP|nr:unnamed protein product [Diatraea saccharalis]
MVVRDNAYNMQTAMRCGNFLSIGCVAHTLQLVIHDVIFKDAASMNLIKKCRKVVGHFKRSEQASRYLERFQETCGLLRHVLIQDIETRWNSTYLMLERLLEQKTAINLYMAERGGIEVPTAEEWEQINYYIAILRCFYQATLDISSDSSSISLIIPLIVMLNSKMTTKDEDPEKVILLKIQLRNSIHRRFSYLKNTPHLMIATLIDPRFKSKYFTNDETENTKTEILSFLRQTGSRSRSAAIMDVDVDEPRPSCSNSDPATEGVFTKKKDDDLWDSHDNLASSVTITSENELGLDHPGPPFQEHLTCFLKEPLLLRNADIYEYWSSSPYTYLRPIAIKYLSAPPSSVPSEQLFCAAGRIYADRRSNLIGENVDKLLFLAYNIRLFNFDY